MSPSRSQFQELWLWMRMRLSALPHSASPCTLLQKTSRRRNLDSSGRLRKVRERLFQHVRNGSGSPPIANALPAKGKCT